VAVLGLAAVLGADGPELTPGHSPIERSLGGGQAQAFTVTLRAGQALSLEVMQAGIDVVVEVRGPKGDMLLQVDSPNGTEGPEPVLFVAEETGRHTLVVRALEAEVEAGRYGVGTLAIRDATPRDRALSEAIGLIGRAYALRAEMKQAEALPLAERALALRETHLGSDDLAVADCLSLLGYLYDEVGDYRRGVEVFARALGIRQRRLTEADPSLAGNISDLGHLRLALGEYDAAEKLFLTALAARERLGVSSAGSLTGLAALHRERGDVAGSRQYRERDAAQRVTPGTSLALGQLELDLGHSAEAEALCEKGRAGSEKGTGFAVWTLASSFECRGLARLALGRPAEAEADLRQSLKIREDVSGPEHPFVASSLTALARALGPKDPGAARALLRRALALRERWLLPTHLGIAETLEAVGDLERAEGRSSEAESAYERALSIYQASAPNHPNREKTSRALEALRCARSGAPKVR
jgi:tetratricopeptide (TPR) repeat protein